jgi:hypothetical protein
MSIAVVVVVVGRCHRLMVSVRSERDVMILPHYTERLRRTFEGLTLPTFMLTCAAISQKDKAMDITKEQGFENAKQQFAETKGTPGKTET